MLTSLARTAVAVAIFPSRVFGFSILQMSSSATTASGGGALNVLGKPLQSCSLPGGPTTGWRRDGFCSTDDHDRGQHCVCSEVTDDFLEYTKAQGNDLSTPRNPYFPGLKPGDRWCLCSSRWLQAQRAGRAPRWCWRAPTGKRWKWSPSSCSWSTAPTPLHQAMHTAPPPCPPRLRRPPKSEL